jgi:hypothetical protein
MARDFTKEARQEHNNRDASHRWIQARIEVIRKGVTAQDILRRNGIKLRGNGDREEQFACPFHGRDNKPSARVYPETVRGPSHVWCFVCQERWDVISLWKKFGSSDAKFTQTLGEIERAFGILPPERPPADTGEIGDEEDPVLLEVDMLFHVCESRLKDGRNSFDMKSYLTLGMILDRLYFQVEEGIVKPPKAIEILKTVLNKIGEKVRAA